MAASIDTTILGNTEMSTDKKLALMKLNAATDFDRDVLSEPATPTMGGRLSGFHSRNEGGARSMSRASRQVSTSRRTSSFLHSHRDKMSSELSSQAESKFMSLMEFMANASREASSLKEYWSRLMVERESWMREKDELMLRIEEVTETLEQKENQHHHHGRELGERKKEVERLLLELTAALAAVAEQKKKVADREKDLERSRLEIHEVRLTGSRTQIDYDRIKAEFEALELKLRACEGDRDHARDDVEKYRSELRILSREHAELKSKYSDVGIRLERSTNEVASLVERIRTYEREREDYLIEKDRLQEELRKLTARADETARELAEMTDRYERLQRDSLKIKETIRMVESERDEHVSTIERLRQEIRTKTTHADEAESRYAEVVLKWEKSKRDITAGHDKLRDVEFELSEFRRSTESRQEEYRLVVVERDQLRDDVDDERRKSSDHHRQVTALQESLSRAEATLIEVRAEVHTTTDKLKYLERERDDTHGKNGHLHTEITELKEKIVLLQAELLTVVEGRDRAHHDLEDAKRKYEEVTETITEYDNGSGELEFEIENLRTMLREAREQKERAIAARTAADRERDEYVAKYEEKCREMERWEQSRASFYSHSHGRGESTRSSTRVFTRTSTAANHEERGSEEVDGQN